MPPERTECSERTGWYEELTITHLRKAVKNAMRQLAGTDVIPRKRKRRRLGPAEVSQAQASVQDGRDAGADDDESGHDVFEEESVADKGSQPTDSGSAHVAEEQHDAWHAADHRGHSWTYGEASAPSMLGSGSGPALEAEQGGIKVLPPPLNY